MFKTIKKIWTLGTFNRKILRKVGVSGNDYYITKGNFNSLNRYEKNDLLEAGVRVFNVEIYTCTATYTFDKVQERNV